MDNLKSELHNEIMREYSFIRANNQAAHRNNKEQIYNHFPRIKEIDDALSKISLRACKSMLNSSSSHEDIITKLKKDTERLLNEKNQILKEAEVPVNFMDEVYTCPNCKDTGVYNNRRCECYFEKLKKLMHKKSNINMNRLHTFENFDISLYPSAIDPSFNISARDNAEIIYETAVKYTKFDPSISKQLFFYGGPGLGKTFTSDCIAKEFIKNGKSVYYTSAPRLFSVFEDYKFGRNSSADAKKIIDYISSVDLLIIDDLATEFRTQYTDSLLFDILNTRINENLHMIISSNLNPKQLESVYSERISSRIMGNFEAIAFIGKDLRISK